MGKGFVTPEMFAGRVSAHGQITSLTAAFSLESGQPFALFIIPKSDGRYADASTVLVDCKLYQDDDSADCPFTCNCWDAPAVSEIAINGIDLTDYDVFWGAGADVNES